MNQQTLLIIEIVMGILTFILASSSAIPQIITIRKTRNTSGISLTSLIICNIDNVCWLVWALGFYFNSMLMYEEPMTRLFQISLLILCFAYIFGSILMLYLMIVKTLYLNKAKKLNITELELSKILQQQDKLKYFKANKWNNFERFLIPIAFVLGDALFTMTIVGLLYTFAYIQPIKGTNEWIWVIIFSFISSIIWEITCWPQLIKSIKEKDTTGMSLFWCIFGAANCIVNFIYDLSLSFNTGGFNYNVLFILIFSALIPNIGVMIIKIINVTKAKKLGLSEIEYTQQVLIPLVEKKKKKKALEKSIKEN